MKAHIEKIKYYINNFWYLCVRVLYRILIQTPWNTKKKKEPFGEGEKFRLKQGSIYEKLNEDSWTLDSTCQNK